MKYPVGWPSRLKVRKIARADAFGSGGEYEITYYDDRIGTFYRSSRGWAYSSDRFGSSGGGYNGFDTLQDAMFAFGCAYAAKEKCT